MTQKEKDQIKRRVALQRLWQWGSNIPDFAAKLLSVILFLVGLTWVWGKQDEIGAYARSVEMLAPVMRDAMIHAVRTYLLVGGVALAILMVYPFDRKVVQDQLRSIGLVNHAGMEPVLIRKKRDKSNRRMIIWDFRNQSIPVTVWEDKKEAIEAALDVSIVKIIYGKSKSRVKIYAVSSRNNLPEILYWKDEYLSRDSFVLNLGESLVGNVSINLARMQHILIGGGTGSGKSVLLKLILFQALRKGAQVYIADFKGGVDFPQVWHKKCRMCFDVKGLLDTLDILVRELEFRKEWLPVAGFPNIDVYNEETGDELPRIVFACDEVADILDKTGRTKEEKELIAQIERKLAIISTKGRAFGIHLILSTQRPDANLIYGQIRTNLGCRICGRADGILSQIILDSTEAAVQIPKDAQGRFMLHDGTVFQAYWFDETQL